MAVGTSLRHDPLDEQLLGVPRPTWGVRLEDRPVSGPDGQYFDYHLGSGTHKRTGRRH